MNLIATYGKYLAMLNLLFLKALMGERVTKYDWLKFIYGCVFSNFSEAGSKEISICSLW